MDFQREEIKRIMILNSLDCKDVKIWEFFKFMQLCNEVEEIDKIWNDDITQLYGFWTA